MYDDPTSYHTARIKELLSTVGTLTHELIDQVDADVRAMFGVGIGRDARNRRNLELIRDWQRGERIPLLQRRYKLSKSQVYCILKDRFRFLP